MSTDQNRGEKDEYRFIQEKVIPSRRKKWKKVLSTAGLAVVMGIIFGVTAATTFCLVGPWVAERLGMGEQEEQPGESSNVQLVGDQLASEDADTELPEDTKQPGEDDDSEKSGIESDESNKDGQEQNGGNDPEGNVTESDGTGEDREDPADGEGSGENGENDPATEGTELPPQQPTIVEQRIEADLTDFKNMFWELSQMANGVNKSIVRVASVTNGVDWFQNPYETEDETFGLILATDEKLIYIMVSYAHIEQASEIRITFEQNISATASFRDADTDVGLAIVTVKKEDLPRKVAGDIRPAVLGESYSLAVGDPVIALGNPNGFLNSMLLGMVTNRENYAYIPDNCLSLFHTDMQISEDGDGIIVDMDGRVVGIITHTLSVEEQPCTALSISKVRPLLEKMINQTPRIYLGVIGMDLPSTLAAKLDVAGGVYVSEVVAGSPAALAGIRSGDVILDVGENHVFSISALNTYLQEQTPDTTVTLKVCRMVREDAVTIDYEVTLAQKGVYTK